MIDALLCRLGVHKYRISRKLAPMASKLTCIRCGKSVHCMVFTQKKRPWTEEWEKVYDTTGKGRRDV